MLLAVLRLQLLPGRSKMKSGVKRTGSVGGLPDGHAECSLYRLRCSGAAARLRDEANSAGKEWKRKSGTNNRVEQLREMDEREKKKLDERRLTSRRINKARWYTEGSGKRKNNLESTKLKKKK